MCDYSAIARRLKGTRPSAINLRTVFTVLHAHTYHVGSGLQHIVESTEHGGGGGGGGGAMAVQSCEAPTQKHALDGGCCSRRSLPQKSAAAAAASVPLLQR